MRTVEEVRRVRLGMLAKEFTSYAELNARLGRNRRDSGLSQIANESENSKGGKPKVMGSDVARALEEACAKPLGWMDTDPALWPFDRIDIQAVLDLDPRDRDLIAGAMIGAAVQLGLAIQKRQEAA